MNLSVMVKENSFNPELWVSEQARSIAARSAAGVAHRPQVAPVHGYDGRLMGGVPGMVIVLEAAPLSSRGTHRCAPNRMNV